MKANVNYPQFSLKTSQQKQSNSWDISMIVLDKS